MKTINHKTVRRQLPFFIEGSLPENEQQRILAHLEACADCREYLDDLRKSWELLAEVNRVEAGPYFVVHVKNRLSAASSQASNLVRRAWQPAIILLLLILGIRFGVWVGSRAEQPMNTTEQAVLLPFDDLSEEPIEAFLLNIE